MGEAFVEIQSLCKSYRSGGLFRGRVTRAVDDVSLQLDAATGIFAIVGQSGSGKTTLARMLLRLVSPDSGSIRLDGRPLVGRGAVDSMAFRRMVQPIFQNPFEAFSLHLPVDSYLFATASRLAAARDARQAADLADGALTQVGLNLGRVRGKYVHQFSGGELQRISIARALIVSPRLIVADEPVSMVDASLRMTIVNLFQDIRRSRGISFLYITHDLSTAYYLSDRVAIMNRGKIVETGDPRRVLLTPEHPYTRSLIDAIPSVDHRWPELQRGTAKQEPIKEVCP